MSRASRQHRYYLAHRDELLRKASDVTVTVRRARNARSKQWRAAHPDKVKLYNKSYYSKKKENERPV